MSKFTENKEAYSEQIRSMRKDGKSYAEIKAFFQKTYGIALYDGAIAKIMKGIKVARSPGKKKTRLTIKMVHEVKKGLEKDHCDYLFICKFSDMCRPEICKFKGV